MGQFIEFTTRHTEKTYGNPIYRPEKLRRFRDVEAVRVDGEPVKFRDASIPERLGRYLVESSRRRRRINDCVAFVALMNGIPFDGKSNPFRHFDRSVGVSPAHVNLSFNTPLVLVQGFHDMQIPRHMVLPAHSSDQQNYLHKLGDDGPLCMSDLRDALRIMDCTSAHPVEPDLA